MAKYILALIPVEQSPYIRAAQELFSKLSPDYLLRENLSLPHITFCQFYTTE